MKAHRDRRRRGWILGSRAVGRGKADASDAPAGGFHRIPEVLGAGTWPYFGFNLP